MCGLFGWSLDGAPTRALALTLAWGAEARGDRSTGLIARGPEGERTHRLLRKASACLAELSAPEVAAHTRYPTHGAVSEANTHPFTRGRVSLMHNGVLSNHRELNVRYGRTCVVDSEHLALHLDSGLPLGDIEGYGVIVWTETGERGFLICQVSPRGDLSVAQYGDRGVVWHSEREPIERAAALDAVKATFYDIEPHVVYRVCGGEVTITGRRLALARAAYERDWRDGYADTTLVDRWSEALWDTPDPSDAGPDDDLELAEDVYEYAMREGDDRSLDLADRALCGDTDAIAELKRLWA